MWDGILNGCAWLLSCLAHLVGDWGLAIIIVTLIIRIALSPLQHKQYKSTHSMKEMQPKISRIQELYAGDQQKISEETMKIYQEVGFNPVAGCLPMLVQMPVFIILFQTLRWKIGDYATPELPISFFQILPDLTLTVPETGMNVVYCIFAVFFIVLSVGPMIYQMVSGQMGQQSQGTQFTMLIFMGLMFIYMAWISPAGVILYWALSSGFGFVQQIVINKRLDKEAEEREAAKPMKPVEVNVERKEKKKRQHKKR